MSEKASFLAGNGLFVGAGVVLVGGLAIGAFSGILGPSDPAPAPVEVAQPVVAQPVATPLKPAQPAPAPAPVPEKEVSDILRPSFDVVRVETDGNTLIAGQGALSRPITILMDGRELARAETDGSGKFVSFVELPPSDAPRVLSLVQTGDDGEVTSEDTVIIAPTPAAAPIPTAQEVAQTPIETAQAPSDVMQAPEETVPEPAAVPQDEPQLADATEYKSAQSMGTVTETSPAAETPATTAEAPTETAPAPSTTILKADADGVTVLQAPVSGDPAPDVMSTVALDAISYSAEGEVELSGRGTDAGFVRVYLDNKPVTSSRIAPDGNWRTELPDVDSGVYTLRVDQVDEEGAVTSRIETPFKREDETVVEANQQAAMPSDAAPVRVVTVQPGSTLWAIAIDRYGSGTQYVRVFEANRDRIRDPDLIYPGQIFEIPE
ncbi:LysM peptidoglycan-binding domain-containing protein [Shimia sp. SDUM112013]|uniref:LysM peptidoglycan-binding domain-containing protein n=1 Tax=Shimia sp. SDUM112013 TaxID=3136160 RepID=UPI0032F09372